MADAKQQPDPQFDKWRQRLKDHAAGRNTPLAVDEIVPGFYRNRGRAYAFWYIPDKADPKAPPVLRARVNSQNIDLDRACYSMPYCWKEPVTREWYDEYLKTGTWPDQHTAVTQSNNAPPDDTPEGVQADIENLAFQVDLLFKKGAAKTQTEADQAADLSDRLSKLWKKADDLRKVQKQPHLDASREVDDKWRPALDLALVYKDIKKVIIQPFLDAENARIEAENARIREEQERVRRENAQKQKEAEDRAWAAGEDPDGVFVPPEPVPETPPELLAPASAGTRGKKVSGRKVVTAHIEDWDALWKALKDRDDVKEFLQGIADKAAKGGNPLPGTTSKNSIQAV